MGDKFKLKFRLSTVMGILVIILGLAIIIVPNKQFITYVTLIALGILNIAIGFMQTNSRSKVAKILPFVAGITVLIIGITGIIVFL